MVRPSVTTCGSKNEKVENLNQGTCSMFQKWGVPAPARYKYMTNDIRSVGSTKVPPIGVPCRELGHCMKLRVIGVYNQGL